MTDKEGGLGEQIEEMQKYFFWGGGGYTECIWRIRGRGEENKALVAERKNSKRSLKSLCGLKLMKKVGNAELGIRE